MAVYLPYAYVVRPRRAVVERFPRAWFAEPRVWSIESPGDHDFEGQQRIHEAKLKLAVLAQIHERAHLVRPDEHEMDRAQRESARALIEWAPLTLETFDRLFELDPVGIGCEDVALDRMAEESLRAVCPDEGVMVSTGRGDIPLRSRWAHELERRASVRACALAGLRFVVPRLFEELADRVQPPECVVNALGVVADRELHDALTSDGWVITPRAKLRVVLMGVRDFGDVELECACTVRAQARTTWRGTVVIGMRGQELDWTVADAKLSTVSVRSLLPSPSADS